MVPRKSVFTLRYGESDKNDMLVRFNDDETILENLSHIIPSAVQRGYLPKECTAESVKVVYGDRVLNPNLTLREQVPNIQDREVLILRDLSSTIRLRIRYKPDNVGERTDSAFVNPNKILGSELAGFFKGVSGDYRFYRRKAKKFSLRAGKRKLNLKKSLVAQGYEAGFDARLAPRLIFRWPPGIYAITLFSVLIVAVVVLIAWRILSRPPEITTFRVSFITDADCKLIKGDSLVCELAAGGGRELKLDSGDYEFEVMPRDYPIFNLPVAVNLAAADGDSISIPIKVQERFRDTESVSLTINGYWDDSPDNKIREGLLVNRYERTLDGWQNFKTELPRGIYEIKFMIPDERHNINGLKKDPGVLHREEFRFNFHRFRGNETTISLNYVSEGN